MRVVAGTAKGRRLLAPPGDTTRPTPNRVREAIFNSLYSMGAIEDTRVLDLFAGTGALGIEALSRGAREAVFVETDPRTAEVLRSNLQATGLADRARVMVTTVEAALSELTEPAAAQTTHEATHGDPPYSLNAARADRPHRFDVALADPPYGFDAWPDLLKTIPARLVVIESDRAIDVTPTHIALQRKRYGGTVVTFATAVDDEPHPSGARQ